MATASASAASAGGSFGKMQDGGDHLLYLALFRTAISDYGLFDFQRAIFKNRNLAHRTRPVWPPP